MYITIIAVCYSFTGEFFITNHRGFVGFIVISELVWWLSLEYQRDYMFTAAGLYEYASKQ